MRGCSGIALCVVGVLIGSMPAAAAVDDYIGKPIASVRLLVEGRETTEASLVRVIETRVGQPLAMPAVRDSIMHLFTLGRFDDVRVDASMVDADRVALRYELSPLHSVTRIDFAGKLDLSGVDTGQLRKAVEDRYGASPAVGRAAAAAAVVADLLRERGYLHADVRPRVDILHAPDRATLVFTIVPGARTTVDSIDVVGTPAPSRAALLHRLRLARGAPYQPDALNARIDQYIAGRRKAGYYEAKLVVTPSFADGDRLANLTLLVTQGPHVRVVFLGDPLPADQRAELVPIEREGSVDEDLLEDSTNRIVDRLRGQGYRDAAAPHSRAESGDELRITFDVKRGPEYRVDRVELSGNQSVPSADFEPGLRLRAGEPFAQSKLDADLSMIQDLYRRRGFAAAKAQPCEEPERAGPGARDVPLRVRILITEGPRTLVSGVSFQGNGSLPDATLKEGLGSQPGRPYLDAQLALDRDAVQVQYLNRGYPDAAVDANPNFSADRTSAEPVFTVRAGTRILVDHVVIVGNVRTSTETIERELRIRPGDPLSETAKIDGRQRLATLGLFRRVQITELALGDEGRRDLIVTVEESPPTTVVVGGGGEGRVRVVPNNQGVATDLFEIAPRGSFAVSRRNLFGKNRSVSLFTSVSLPLFKDPVFGAQGNVVNDQLAVPEYQVIGTYREPRVFDTAANAVVSGTFEQQARSSFNFARRAATAEIERRVKGKLRLSASYQIQNTIVFDDNVSPADQLLVDRLFPQVRLSSVSSSVIRDTRDDLVDPGAGEYLSANFQLAGRRIGSEVGFAKTYMRAQLFRTVPGGKRFVLAGNATLGLATAFPQEVVATGAQGQVTTETIENLPVSERFFAGGDTTVRGFALDTLGTPQTIGQNGFPIGGNGMVIFNAELRAPVRGAIGVVAFIDSGNVFANASDIALTELRSAVGFGIRYKSPVGPIRVDLGFKVHREIVAGSREALTALNISLGQAF
jgi:outer membrane protein insertion porin family